MNLNPNPLFYKMALAYHNAKKKGTRLIICNEGGTRAGKTFDAFDLITTICEKNRNAGLDIYILRDTLVRCRDYTLKDWKKLAQLNGLAYSGKDTPKPEFQLFGNNIYFRGLDDPNSEGYPSDILFFNEVLEMDKKQVDDLLMRNRKLAIFDWNPKLTKHWIFDFEKRDNVLWTRTTYKDNKHLEQSVIDGIEAYNPDNPINVINKTADIFRWKVYGLGLRADQEGNVFNDSKLNKFNLSDIDLTNCVKVAFVDVADQGADFLSMPIGALIDGKVYIIDWLFTDKPLEYWYPLCINLIEKYDIDRVIFESNNQGLIVTKYIRDKINEKYKKRISALPTTSNKHSRIVNYAETAIIPDFYFLNSPSGMYSEAYDYLLSYKHDGSFKKDDAPDSLAGLAKNFNYQNYRTRK